MHSYEERKEAIKLYYTVGKSLRKTVKILGYPDESTLSRWIKKFERTEEIPEKRPRWEKYSQEEKERAVNYHLHVMQN